MTLRQRTTFSYHPFVMSWISTHMFATLLFLVLTVGLASHGISTTSARFSYDQFRYVINTIIELWIDLAPQLALLVTAVVLSLIQYRVVQRRLNILSKSWFYATVIVLFIGFGLNFLGMHHYVLTQTLRHHTLPAPDKSVLMLPLYATFFLLALVQGACLRRYGWLNAALWVMASLVPLTLLFIVNMLILYPLLHGIIGGVFCYRTLLQQEQHSQSALL